VVCRQLDWRVNHRVIVADFTTRSWILLTPRLAHVLPPLDRSPHTAETLEAALSRSRHPLPHFEVVRLLEDLVTNGLAVLAESDFTKTHDNRRAMARAATASGSLLPVVEQPSVAEGCCH
jgi:hypothetical protein